jgi:hypothetical protein
MKKYARIDDGIISDIFETDRDISELFHPKMIWAEAPAKSNASVGWNYIDGGSMRLQVQRKKS